MAIGFAAQGAEISGAGSTVSYPIYPTRRRAMPPSKQR